MLRILFNKVAGLLAYNLLKKTPTKAFSCNFSEIFKNTYDEIGTLENGIYLCFLISGLYTPYWGK